MKRHTNSIHMAARRVFTLFLIFCATSQMLYGNEKSPTKAVSASYGYTALAVGIGTPVALPWGRNWDVLGLEFNLVYGECQLLRGVQVGGIANVANREMRGVQAAFLFDYTPVDAWGWQFSLGGNVAKRVFGLQSAFGINFAEELHGAQIGIVNYTKACPGGFQIGLANFIMDNQIPLIPIFNCYF